MLSFASRLYVQISVVTRNADRLHGVFLMLARKFLELIVDGLRNQVALLDPSFKIARRTHLGESAIAVKYLNPLSILNNADLVVDRGDLIAQRRLRGRHVCRFERSASATIAGNTTDK
jgi:hypothetical protein